MSKRIVALSIVALVVVSVFIPGSPLRAASGPFFRGAANIRQQQACQVSWANANGGLWSDANNWSTGAVPGSGSHVCINLGGTYTVTLDASTTVRSLSIGAASGTQTLWIKGNAAGSVTLTVTDGLTNSGVIRLESDADGAASGLTVANGVLANGTTGVINVNQGSGGARTISAALNNQGDVNVGANLSWNRANSAHSNSGDIQLTGGDLTLTQSGNDPSFTNSGVISIAGGRSLTIVGGSFSNVNPGSIVGGGTLNINNARFQGVGTIAANVNNAGQLSPGASLGSLTVSGNYTQFAGGVLNLELGSSSSGIASDLLNVTGSATLAGTLNISRINGFRPNPCDRSQVLKYASQTGSFGEITGLSLGSGLFLRTDFGADELSLTAYSNASEVNVHPTSVNVAEGGATATYRLCLVSQPTHDVSVTLSPDSQVTTDSASVSFTAAAWTVVRSVVVTAVNDTAVEGQHTGTIAHTAISSDPRYNGVAVPSVTATIADNDAPAQPPVAEDSSVATPEDTPIVITMVATDPDSSTLTYSIVEQPDHGDLGPISGNQVIYTPDANFHGADDFRFRANDGARDSNIARVSITVAPVNDAPVAQNVTVSTDEDDGITITLVATDVDDVNLTYSIVEHPAHGDLGAVNGNRVRYEPDNDFVGTDTFKFRANDGKANSNTATVTIHVGQENDPPVAQNSSVTTDEDTAVTITLIASDPEGQPLTYSIVEQPDHGDLGPISGNQVIYTPDANFHGADDFRFRANDGARDSNIARVSITVAPVNDAPVAQNVTVSTGEDDSVTITLIATDVDDANLTYSIVEQPSHGDLGPISGNRVRYTPDNDFVGTDTFKFRANDGDLNSNIATVTVHVGQQNQPPVAQDGSVNTPEDTSIIITLVATDPEGSALTYHIVRMPEHGVLGRVAGNPNKVTYTPAPNFNGADSFTFKANDGASDSNVATVSITVSAVNDPPIARDDSATTPIGTPVNIPVLANDSDIDGDSLTVAAVTQPLHGSAAINANNTVRYTPNAGYTGPDAFSYTVSDGHGGSDTAEVTITVTPVSVPDARGKIEFTGFVQALPNTASLIGTWKVQGLTVRVTEDTELKLGGPGRDKDCLPPWRPCNTASGSSFGVGSFVEVEGVLLADGVVVAREIELAKPEHPPKPPPPPRDKDKDRDDDGKITLCHIPPGNSGAAHTITVDGAAARAHLSHGDTLGRCSGDDDDDDDDD